MHYFITDQEFVEKEKKGISEGNFGDTLLFFPRRKVSMFKTNRNNASLSWFINRSLREEAVSLDMPTCESLEGIASGLRSAIIKTKGGKYIRLKGVRPKLHLKYGTSRWGCCALEEAVLEQVNHATEGCIDGYKEDFRYPIKPFMIEIFPFTSELLFFDGMRLRESKRFFVENRNNFFDRVRDYHYMRPNDITISALEIKADTRFDEVIYHLTKNDLRGEKKLARDRILVNLSYLAGIAKGCLSASGSTWASDKVYTNNHIGNFLIYEMNGLIYVGVTDLGDLRNVGQFDSEKEFVDFLNHEFESYKDDFNDRVTSSTTMKTPYRHFPQKLRRECLKSFRRGYLYLVDKMAPEYLPKGAYTREVMTFKGIDNPVIYADEFRYESMRLS